MKTLKNSNGFSTIHALLILVILGIVGCTGWYVWNANEEAKNSTPTRSSTGSTSRKEPLALIKVYADDIGGFRVNYPENWKLTESQNIEDPQYKTSDAKLTSPTGTVLRLRSDMGGKGGDCIPDQGDVPFSSGNACPTKEYLSSEILPTDNLYYADSIKGLDGNFRSVFKETDVLLVTSHYADNDGRSQYTIGLKDSDPQFPVILNKPTMGFVMPEHFIVVYNASGEMQPYIYATASSDKQSFLKSKDATTVKAILRSLKID